MKTVSHIPSSTSLRQGFCPASTVETLIMLHDHTEPVYQAFAVQADHRAEQPD